ncbi:CinA family protein [Polynucleobacter sp. HIN6]|uniref:CinA family protein n=1 Tax=Polynucleobacter sp. HIN6 TaxID=3047865 RepID=UPI0025737CD3|nr:CinA family protein [Polynucleobacter sp. HIN6]BEI34695.1 CinA family protein [Polynucleobacter sp. HIN6]
MNSSITPLVQQLAQTLLAKGLKIASAESCTGGLLAAHLTSLAGSSDWFERGFITYSNQAKEESIGASKELIEQYGAVSEEVAKAMAKGALNHSLAQVSVAITGIAGPGGGSANKPVGMVCFAWGMQVADQIQTRAQTKQFSGDRQSIREQACVYAIESLLGQLIASESR